jgi:hypothetical protein
VQSLRHGQGVLLWVLWGVHPIAKDWLRLETEADEAMEAASDIRQIAFFGDYPPCQCGVAAFTSDAQPAMRQESSRALTPVLDEQGRLKARLAI